MTLSADIMQRAADVVAEMHREVQAMRGLFRLRIGQQSFELPIEGYDWQSVPGTRVQMCAIPPADWPADPLPDSDYFYARGPKGAEQPIIEVAQAVRLEVMSGSLDFWKDSAPAYVPYYAGDVFTLVAGERHGWRATGDFVNRIAFSPRITQA